MYLDIPGPAPYMRITMYFDSRLIVVSLRYRCEGHPQGVSLGKTRSGYSDYKRTIGLLLVPDTTASSKRPQRLRSKKMAFPTCFVRT